MKKLLLPKNAHKGLKVYCSKCKKYKPLCTHYEKHTYVVWIYVPGENNKLKSRKLDSRKYDLAVKEAIDFKQ